MVLKLLVFSAVLVIVSGSFYVGDDVQKFVDQARAKLEFGLEDVSLECQKQLEAYVTILGDDLKAGTIYNDNWAWQMFDASSKVSSGLLAGNVFDMGHFDECLAVESTEDDVVGKYCYAAFVVPIAPIPEKSRTLNKTREVVTKQPQAYFPSICIPNECKPSDFIKIINFPIEMANDAACQYKDEYLVFNAADISFMTFMVVILLLIVISTSYDLYLHKTKERAIHPITLAFSFYTNGEKIFKTSAGGSDQLSCLNGMRVFSILWIMAGHRYSLTKGVPLTNTHESDEWLKNPWSEYVQGAPSAVDTFLFISGTLVSYSFIKLQSQPKARFNLVMFYLHRYLRLTPALAVVYFYYITVARHITTGPQWPFFMENEIDKCHKYWWSFFLYIQNFVNVDRLCLLHTWYLSLDMQIFFFSPALLLPLVKYPKYAFYALIGLILVSVIPPIVICYHYELVMYSKDYDHYYYYMPYTRVSPWLIGVLLGIILLKYKDRKVKIHWAVNLVIWAIVLIGMILILYYVNVYAYSYDRVSTALLIGLHRLFWAVGLSWIVFACTQGYGGIVNWILSIPLFQVIARISYSMYLVHILLLVTTALRKRMPYYWDDYEVLNNAFGDIIAISFISLLWTLMFESPMIIIEKIIFGGGGKRPVTKEEITSPQSANNAAENTVESDVKTDEIPKESVKVPANEC